MSAKFDVVLYLVTPANLWAYQTSLDEEFSDEFGDDIEHARAFRSRAAAVKHADELARRSNLEWRVYPVGAVSYSVEVKRGEL